MYRRAVILVLAASCMQIGSGRLFAQHRGGGANRGLGAAAGAASKGIARSGDHLSRAIGKAPSPAADLGRSMNGLQRARAAMERVGSPEASASGRGLPLSQATRILEHRGQQADHLRSLSARNGNEALLKTADRMDANAVTNFQRQTGELAPETLESAASEGEPAATFSPSRLPSRGLETATRVKRGFWFRAR